MNIKILKQCYIVYKNKLSTNIILTEKLKDNYLIINELEINKIYNIHKLRFTIEFVDKYLNDFLVYSEELKVY